MLTQWFSWIDNTALSVVGLIVRSNIILIVAFGSRLSVRDLVVIQSVSLAIHLDLDSTVVHEEPVFSFESRESLLDDAGIVGVLYVHSNHLREKLWTSYQQTSDKFWMSRDTYRRLAAVHIVLPRAIRHEANLVNDVQEILDDVQSDLGERALGSQKTLYDPERIPIVWLPETTSGYDERAVHWNERAYAARAVACANILTSQIGPNINDLTDEIADVRAVNMVQECGICCKVF